MHTCLTLSTSLPQVLPLPVDNLPFTFFANNELSTKNVDNSVPMWIKIFYSAYMGSIHLIFQIQLVDKPVDNRGKICG
jgi:hypothetical protein